MQFSETDTANDVKTRSRYELKSFRGVDTTSAPSEVATTRATYMQNFINRDGTNHKRYGWCEDLTWDTKGGTVYSTFQAIILGMTFYFYKIDNYVIAKWIDAENVKKSEKTSESITVKGGECQFYYSNEKVYIVGNSNLLVFGYFDNKPQFKLLSDIAFAPLVLTGISADGQDTSVLKTEALYDYNLLTNNVKFGLRGIDNTSGNITYTLPHKCSFNDSSYVEINGVKYKPLNASGGYIKGSNIIADISGLIIAKDGEFYAEKLSITTPESLTRSDITYRQGTLFMRFSNGYYLWWNVVNDGKIAIKLTLYNSNKDIIIDNIGYIQQEPTSNTFRYCYVKIEDIDTTNWELDSENECKITEMNYANDKIKVKGTFATPLNKGDFGVIEGNQKIGNLTDNKIVFSQAGSFTPKLFDSTKNVEGETNIFVQCYDEEYKPKYNLNEAKFSCLFGADGACDRIFLSGVKLTNQKSENDNGMECPNLVFWSEISDNVNFENNAFSYFPETSYATIGATQNAVTGMTRLNDSTLAIFREKQVGENNFSILTATYTSIDSYTIGTTEYEEPVLKVSVASANMPQTAINNNCFGALANDVLFASDMGVYAIAISTGTSVERYALERSEPISNMFEHLDMANAKAIVYKNKYYLAAKYTKDDNTKEDIVLIADARYSYSLDRNMDDTYNYEWYLWTNCPVQKWIIEDDKLGFFDYDGRKCFFEKDNFVDMFYLEVKSITKATGYNDEIIYAIDSNLIGKTFAVLKGLKYLDTKQDVPVEDARKLVFKFKLTYPNLYKLTLNDEETNYYIDTSDGTTVQIVDASCVEALWFTPTLDLGASDYRKTLFKLSIGLDHKSHGKVAVGWKTRYDLNQSCASIDVKNAKEFSFDDLDFTTLTFGSEFDSSYTTNLKLRDFTYLQLFFGSNDASDIAVNNIVMLYKYNKFNGGNW